MDTRQEEEEEGEEGEEEEEKEEKEEEREGMWEEVEEEVHRRCWAVTSGAAIPLQACNDLCLQCPMDMAWMQLTGYASMPCRGDATLRHTCS